MSPRSLEGGFGSSSMNGSHCMKDMCHEFKIDLIGSVSSYNMMISIDGLVKIMNRLTVFVEFGKAFKVVVVDEIVDTLSQNFFR